MLRLSDGEATLASSEASQPSLALGELQPLDSPLNEGYQWGITAH